MDMHVEPTAEHRWLLQWVGNWTVEATSPGADGEAPSTQRGTETISTVGDLWIVAKGEGEMPGGGRAITQMTLGFDPETGRFRGTWVGSMMTHQWVYEGTLDPATNTLNLDAEGPDFFTGTGTCVYRDAYQWVDDSTRVLRSMVRQEDGSWGEPFMTATYRRASSGSSGLT